MIFLIRIASIVLSIAAILMIVIASVKNAQKKLTEVVQNRKESFAKRERNRYVSDYFNFKLAKKLDEIYKYSRFYKTKLGKNVQTSYGYFCITGMTGGFLAAFTLLLTRNLFAVAVIFFFTFVVFYGYLFILKTKNKAAVSKDIELFLQLLGNYSTANTEIMSVFMQISPQMRQPLQDCLIECVAETQNIEKRKLDALENLANKIEHEKFREIIYSLSIAEKYNSNFLNVVMFNKDSLQNFSSSQRKKKQIVRQNGTTIVIMVAILIVCLAFVGQFTGTDVWNTLMTTPVGHLIMIVSGGALLYFLFKVINFGA